MSWQPQRVFSTGSKEGSFPCAFGIGKPAAGLQVDLNAGTMLSTQTDEELVNITACQVGHSYAYHEAERKSWRLLLNTVIIGSLAIGSSIGLLPLAAAAVGIDAVVNKVLVGIWLHRRQQYQADAMGAAISMAAGCSLDSIISYMQRAHLSEALDRIRHVQSTDATFSQSLEARSASLRQLVPKSDLPEGRPFDLQELQAWICISASEAKRLSPEAKTEFDAKASEHWPQVVKCMGFKDLDAKAKYDHRLGIRKDSDVHLTGDINEFEMLFAKHGWISRKQACMTKFCSLTEKL